MKKNLLFTILSIFLFTSLGWSLNKLSHVKNYLVYYGDWGYIQKKSAHKFDLIILHPGKTGLNINLDLVKDLQKGSDGQKGNSDDSLVLAYVSIGEDENQNTQPRYNRIGFEGPIHYENGKKVLMKNGYRNWTMDQVALKHNKNNQKIWLKSGFVAKEKGSDGLPDENGKWQSYYVDISNKAWQQTIKRKIKNLIHHDHVDGIFLDTLDTASPWGNYAWMQKPMVDFLVKLREWFPETIFIMNRGLFLFEKYGDILNKNIDALMFESYVSEWDWYRKIGVRHRWYNSNKKLLEENLSPLNKKRNGIKIFFLNYINPTQNDSHRYYQTLQQDTGHLNCLHYFSSPDLQRIHKPINTLIFFKDKRKMMTNIFYKDGISYLEIKKPFLDKIDLNKLRVSLFDENKQVSLLPFENIKESPKKNVFELPFLQKGRYSAVVDYIQNEILISSKISLDIPKQENILTPLANINFEAYDESILCSWKKHSSSKETIIEWIDNRGEVFFKKTTENKFLITGLSNGKTYFIKLKPLKKGLKSFFSAEAPVTPTDCTPPLPPILKSCSLENQTLKLKFAPYSSFDHAGFYLYIDANALKKSGLPIKIPSYLRNWSVELPKKGVYEISLSSFDANNNESFRTKTKIVSVKNLNVK